MSARTVRAYVGLGANVGDAERTLAEAIDALAALPGVRLRGVSACTPPPRSASPISPTSATRSWRSTFRPARTRRRARRRALAALKGLERDFGRRRRRRWGPRELDLDLLVFGRARLAIDRPPRPAQSRPRPILPRRHACSRSRIGTPGSGCSCSRRWPISRRGSFRPAGTGRSRHSGASEPPSRVRTRSGRSGVGRGRAPLAPAQPRKRVSSAVSTAPPSAALHAVAARCAPATISASSVPRNTRTPSSAA